MSVNRIQKTIRNRVTNLIFYNLERFLLKGPVYHFLLFSLILILVSVVAGSLVWFFSDFEDFPGAVWWAFLRLTDPGYLGDDKGIFNRSVSTVVTVLGYILFMGTLIAAMNQSLSSFIRRLESGITPISDDGHILLLGYNENSFLITQELLSAQNRLERFLIRRGIGRKNVHIVFLAEVVNAGVRQLLKSRLANLWQVGKVTLRSGTPLNIEDLERVAYARASTIILPAPTNISNEPEVMDSQVIKTLLSIYKQLGPEHFKRLCVTAEVIDPRRTLLVDQILPASVRVVATATVMSRILAQSLKHPGLASAYSVLLTNRLGPSIRIKNFPDAVGKSFLQVASQMRNGIAIGVVQQDGQVTLLPNRDERIEENCQIIYVSRSAEVYIDEALNPASAEDPAKSVLGILKPKRKVFIFGWSSRIPYLLEELTRESHCLPCSVLIVSKLSIAAREKDLRELFTSTAKLDLLEHVVADYTIPSLLRSLPWQEATQVLFMASDVLLPGEDADSRTTLGFHLARSFVEKAGVNPPMVIEMQRDENAALISKGEVLVSPKITSHILAGISLKAELEPVFDCLFESRGCYLSIAKVEGCATFREVQEYLPLGRGIALGLYSVETGEIKLQPPFSEPVLPHHRLVMIAGSATMAMTQD